jgi:uncharacterized protein YneF (UPF0154 family)
MYVIMRLLFGKIAGTTINVKTFRYTKHQHNPPQEKEEGTVIIEDKGQKNTSPKNDQLGEYVDYEEVK